MIAANRHAFRAWLLVPTCLSGILFFVAPTIAVAQTQEPSDAAARRA